MKKSTMKNPRCISASIAMESLILAGVSTVHNLDPQVPSKWRNPHRHFLSSMEIRLMDTGSLPTSKNSQKMATIIFWANYNGRCGDVDRNGSGKLYNDLSRGHLKWWFSKGNLPKIPYNSGLRNCTNLAFAQKIYKVQESLHFSGIPKVAPGRPTCQLRSRGRVLEGKQGCDT